MNLIDLHSHILPGVDDGSSDLEQSLAMAEIACRDGISIIVATPHVIKGIYMNRKEDILKQVDNINTYLKYSRVKLSILPGAEYHLEPDLPGRLAAGELLTLNNTGRYLLVELPANLVPEYTDQILHGIQLQGVTPIIAHPERNRGLAKQPELLQEWAGRGILAQVTSGSITGQFGRGVKKRALKYLQIGVANLIASDAHDARGRSPVLSSAFQEIESLWGIDLAHTLTVRNPELVIKGLPLKPSVRKLGGTTWAQNLQRFLTPSNYVMHK